MRDQFKVGDIDRILEGSQSKLYHPFDDGFRGKNESMACFVSRRYMRGENGKDSLVVCLSEYLNLCRV